jgi:hypothetical protein
LPLIESHFLPTTQTFFLTAGKKYQNLNYNLRNICLKQLFNFVVCLFLVVAGLGFYVVDMNHGEKKFPISIFINLED